MNTWSGRLAVAILCAAAPVAPTASRALEACKAKLNPRDGSVEVSAAGLLDASALRFGESEGVETRTFDDLATCLAAGRLRKCHLGPVGSVARITPPASCQIFLADGASASCSAHVRGCVPGLRPDAAGAVPALFLEVEDGQVLTSGVTTNLAFDAVHFDATGLFDPATPDEVRVSLPGYYYATAAAGWDPVAMGNRELLIMVESEQGGDLQLRVSAIQANSTIEPFTQSGGALLRLLPGDRVRVRAAQTSGSDLDMSGRLWLHYVGPLERNPVAP